MRAGEAELEACAAAIGPSIRAAAALHPTREARSAWEAEVRALLEEPLLPVGHAAKAMADPLLSFVRALFDAPLAPTAAVPIDAQPSVSDADPTGLALRASVAASWQPALRRVLSGWQGTAARLEAKRAELDQKRAQARRARACTLWHTCTAQHARAGARVGGRPRDGGESARAAREEARAQAQVLTLGFKCLGYPLRALRCPLTAMASSF
jgi:hypothetical protein